MAGALGDQGDIIDAREWLGVPGWNLYFDEEFDGNNERDVKRQALVDQIQVALVRDARLIEWALQGLGYSEWVYRPNGTTDIVVDANRLLVGAAPSGFGSHPEYPEDTSTFHRRGSQRTIDPPCVDFDQLRRSSGGLGLPSVAQELLRQPDEVLPCFGLALLRGMVLLVDNSGKRMEVPRGWSATCVPRIHNISPVTRIQDIAAHLVGRLVCIQGTVIRASSIRQQLTAATFDCARCGGRVVRTFRDYVLSPPKACEFQGCRSRQFSPDLDQVETVDWQRLTVQELRQHQSSARPLQSDHDEGPSLRTIDVEVVGDLVDQCMPGDRVNVCGIVRALNVGSEPVLSRGAGRSSKGLSTLFVGANSLAKLKSRVPKMDTPSSSTDGKASRSDPDFAENELELFRSLFSEKHLFSILVHSLCPSILGHEVVKAGLLLSLLGGNPQDVSTVGLRSDIHVLLVGDPGLGKSQMLRAVSAIAPRGVYVCGGTSTTAGLTVAVSREPGSGDFSLEAGALVLGDQGICCVDEFDKMNADHHSLLEAMEQQSVSVAKAGILCNLSARTGVVAAANPVGGHYTKLKTVCENLKISSALLSRFDLVFVMVDKPDGNRDRCITDHVLNMLKENMGTTIPDTVDYEPTLKRLRLEVSQGRLSEPSANRKSLVDELRRTKDDASRKRLSPMLLCKFIMYARRYVRPNLSDEAKDILQAYYLALRKSTYEKNGDHLPVTCRQLESVIRLAEARAKAELRDLVTAEDAMDVVEISQESMIDTYSDEAGRLDFGRSTGMSKSNEKRKFWALICAEAQRSSRNTFHISELKRLAQNGGLPLRNLDQAVDSLNTQGFLLKKPGRMWQIVPESAL
uniref:DNA helicase n=1 Tax=Compsopogon caeruleus TaxID=31354 RepID=A0A7S1T7Z7_9RHOD|mmetsp:Transcript_1269/g.2673  ORF Transcript_1269/g.2673 Transcript_1269/m.2673 type:complete len:855 (+) Transcript_1269:322-2886(+)|eukprot:CAMPEP_0184685036 /NCGR_PEP_ID=MMETSP0312-20130426/17443_1 /TAXON_ID=31354 /ORGANISM="Compsopogon coeruleus, Strain SAG 36.94" /LENGTH=854 /DNA_ID=CAMNT_0027138741 /DNA_START=283 /DNA_END=2847 /DNA_ORIENTATION=-